MKILVTASAAAAQRQAAALRQIGMEPLIEPAIEIHPLPFDDLAAAFDRIHEYSDLILTSPGATSILGGFLRQSPGRCDRLASLRIAVVGRRTAAVLSRETGLAAAIVPAREDAEGLIEALGDPAGRRFLYPCARSTRGVIEARLGERVTRIPIYETRPRSLAHLAPLIRDGSIRIVLFSSSSAVDSFFDSLEEVLRAAPPGGIRYIAIGRPTAAAIRERGHESILARSPAPEDLARAAGITFGGVSVSAGVSSESKES